MSCCCCCVVVRPPHHTTHTHTSSHPITSFLHPPAIPIALALACTSIFVTCILVVCVRVGGHVYEGAISLSHSRVHPHSSSHSHYMFISPTHVYIAAPACTCSFPHISSHLACSYSCTSSPPELALATIATVTVFQGRKESVLVISRF